MKIVCRCELDRPAALPLNAGMHPSPRASVDVQLIALEERLRALAGELAEQAQSIAARLAQGRAVSAPAEAKLARLREAYASAQRRCAQLRARGASLPAAADEC